MASTPANDIVAKGVAYLGQRSAVFVPCPFDGDWCRRWMGSTPSRFSSRVVPCLFDTAVLIASLTQPLSGSWALKLTRPRNFGSVSKENFGQCSALDAIRRDGGIR